MSTQILGKYTLIGNIVCLTGLHVGGSTAGLEIGGLDNPVIKDPLTDEPIIPGSSLKGKMRTLTEWYLGLIEPHKRHGGYQAYACEELQSDPPPQGTSNYKAWENALFLARLYGPASDNHKVRITAGPTRLTVRDSFLTNQSRTNLQNNLGKGSFTEIKTENALDRVTSEANPRPLERVPAGSVFELNMILDRYEKNDDQLFELLFTAMSMLNHSSLGGGGSRGSGQVSFKDLKLTWRSTQDYAQGTPGVEVQLPDSTVEGILKNFAQIQWPR